MPIFEPPIYVPVVTPGQKRLVRTVRRAQEQKPKTIWEDEPPPGAPGQAEAPEQRTLAGTLEQGIGAVEKGIGASARGGAQVVGAGLGLAAQGVSAVGGAVFDILPPKEQQGLRDIGKGLEVAQSGFRGAFPIAERTTTVPTATRWPTDPEGSRAFQEAQKRGELPKKGQEFRDLQREAIAPLLRGEANLLDTARRLLEVGRATTGPEAWGADFFNPAFWVTTYAVPLKLARPLAAELGQLAARGVRATAPVAREVALGPARLLTGIPEGAGRVPKPRVAGAAEAMGREAIAYGPDPNKVYRMRYRLVEMDSLLPSHTDAFAPNPAYPAELQPRIRERGAARLGVERMARDLVPEALIQDSQALDRGPMIIGSDKVVESGNGRVLALRKARESYPERWQAYQQTLRDSLPQFGIDEAQLAGMRDPVLVRERVSDVDRVRFTAEANQPAVAVFSPVENALQDSKRIRFDNFVVPEETQSLDTTLRARSNQPFVVTFLETLPANERASLLDATGDLNLLGMSRIKAAMFARTYPGEAGRRLTQIFFESREPLIRNIEEGMMASLPKVAQAEDFVRSGQRAADLSIGEDLAAALDMLARVRQRKLSVEQYLGQIQMFQRELTPFQERLLLHIEGLARSPRKVREFLGEYADKVVASPHPQQGAMFAGRQLTKEELFDATIRGQEQGPLFAAAQEVPVARAAEAPPARLVAETSGVPEARVVPAAEVARGQGEVAVPGAKSAAPRSATGVAAVPAGQARAPQAKAIRATRQTVNIAEEKATQQALLASDNPLDVAFARMSLKDIAAAQKLGKTTYQIADKPPAGMRLMKVGEEEWFVGSDLSGQAALDAIKEARLKPAVIPTPLIQAKPPRVVRRAAPKPAAAVTESAPPARAPVQQAVPPAPVPPARPATVAPGQRPAAMPQPGRGGAGTSPVQATQRVKAVHQEALMSPEAVLPAVAKEAHIELGAPDGPRPPKPPGPVAKGAAPDEPSDILRQIAEKATPKERADQTLLRLHEAAIGNEQRRVGIITRDGDQKLKALGVGVPRRGQLVPREQDIPALDALYQSLHNPSRVAAGEMQVPKGYEAIYKELRDLTDWEQTARLDFDPAMATVEDYFYRGWKPPEGAFGGVTQGRPLVRTPSFKKPRVDATYQEMRDAGFEPLFWNPYQQWGLSRMQGTKYREQMELVAHLKGMGDELIQPHAGGPIPEGWRVPEVGPAFEGKPFATTGDTGEPVVMFTRRWLVPDRVANTLENIYGKRPSLGKFIVGGKTIDPLAVVDWLTFVPKRAKLIGTFFQQVDFLTRAGAGSWTRMVDALEAGKPLQAATALAMYPKTVGTIMRANFSPAFRQTLARQLDSTIPIIKGRPGVNLKGISEAGLSTSDVTIFPADMDKLVRQVATETGLLGKAKGVARAVPELESAMRRGLFNGVYRAALITDIQNNIAPMLARMYPNLNDAQLNGAIARLANVKYSTIPASQSVIQNRVLRETLRRVFFSIGESEGLLRQAAGTVQGPYKAFWAKHWLGAYLFVIATASVIHFASTGKPLPKERYVPIAKDKWGPLPFGYNTRFASPTLPFKGRGGSELTLDVVGQMDTALRILNPGAFLSSRESVPVRATVNQVSGTDFFGTPIDDVGPGGVVSRLAQLAQDLFSPIGAGGIGAELARRNIPGAEKVISEGETRLGNVGLGVQATGLNLRAATREQRLRTVHGPDIQETLSALDKLGVELGYVTRRFDTKPGVKDGEIELTSAQREQLQWLTDDTVALGLRPLLASASFKAKTKEQKIEAITTRKTDLREQARNAFRRMLRQLQAPATLTPVPSGGSQTIWETGR